MMLPPDASAFLNRHLLIILIPGFLKHILHLAQFELFSSLGLACSQRFCPCMFQSWLLLPKFSRFCRLSLRCKQLVSRTTSHVSGCFNVRRQNVESPTLNLSRFLDHNSWHHQSRAFFVSCDPLRQLQLWLHHLPTTCQFCFCNHHTRPNRHGRQTSKPIFQIHRFPGITQSLTYPTVASHTSTLGNEKKCSCSILMTDKDSLSSSFQS